MRVRTYTELRRLSTFEERFAYLSLRGEVGVATFGGDRWVNQRFYQSREWKYVRDQVVFRDNGCDLGIPGYEIFARVMVHHMNPVTLEDFVCGGEFVLDPRYLITTTHRTHNAIHYGDETLIARPPVKRTPGDTKLW